MKLIDQIKEDYRHALWRIYNNGKIYIPIWFLAWLGEAGMNKTFNWELLGWSIIPVVLAILGSGADKQLRIAKKKLK